jgi:hypothetical protein
VSYDIVTPRDCALVVAIPRTLSDLEEDLPKADREFARRVLPACKETTAQGAWRRGYGAVMERMAEVISDVRALGVTVVEDARLSDLPQIFADFKVATLVAHSPFPGVTPADILDAEGVLRAIRQQAPGDNGNAVIERLARDENVREASSADQLAKSLGMIIERTKRYYQATEPSGRKSRADLTSLLVYEAFPGAFRPPSILELRDGIHDFEAFCQAVPEDFQGDMEFLACSGLWFSEPLRRRRPNCGDILCPYQTAFLGGRISTYRIPIKLISRHPMSYTNAMNLVHTADRDA